MLESGSMAEGVPPFPNSDRDSSHDLSDSGWQCGEVEYAGVSGGALGSDLDGASGLGGLAGEAEVLGAGDR